MIPLTERAEDARYTTNDIGYEADLDDGFQDPQRFLTQTERREVDNLTRYAGLIALKATSFLEREPTAWDLQGMRYFENTLGGGIDFFEEVDRLEDIEPYTDIFAGMDQAKAQAEEMCEAAGKAGAVASATRRAAEAARSNVLYETDEGAGDRVLALLNEAHAAKSAWRAAGRASEKASATYQALGFLHDRAKPRRTA